MDTPDSFHRKPIFDQAQNLGTLRIAVGLPRNEIQLSCMESKGETYIRLLAARSILAAASVTGGPTDAVTLADSGDEFDAALRLAESREPWISEARLANGSPIWHRLALIAYDETGHDLAAPGTPAAMDQFIAQIEPEATLGAALQLGRVIVDSVPEACDLSSAAEVAHAMGELRSLGRCQYPEGTKPLDLLLLVKAPAELGVVAVKIWREYCRTTGTPA